MSRLHKFNGALGNFEATTNSLSNPFESYVLDSFWIWYLSLLTWLIKKRVRQEISLFASVCFVRPILLQAFEPPCDTIFPELQRSTALLLAYIVKHGGFVQATTHSDFFLNQVNNLIKFYFIKNKDKNRFSAVLKETGISKEFVLNPGDVGAYYFENINGVGRAAKRDVYEKGLPPESFKRA